MSQEKATPTVQIDNSHLRVTEWRFAPGAATGYHRHEHDYVVVPARDGELKLIGPTGEVSLRQAAIGQILFPQRRRRARRHQQWSGRDGVHRDRAQGHRDRQDPMSGPQGLRSALDYLMLLGAAVIYGAVFTVNKIAATGGVPPLAYAFWQSFGAGLLLWIVLTLRGERLSLSRQALDQLHRHRRAGHRHSDFTPDLHCAQAACRGDDAGPGAVAAIHVRHGRGGAARALPLARAARPVVRLCRRGADRRSGRERGGADRLAVVPAGAARAGDVRGIEHRRRAVAAARVLVGGDRRRRAVRLGASAASR